MCKRACIFCEVYMKGIQSEGKNKAIRTAIMRLHNNVYNDDDENSQGALKLSILISL